ncbi:MAG: low molecular weight protein-tyrosine-phosphatase [Flavobacterium sp.]|jgi:protein-tyrosine phosphatase|uniref:low molecular weight protein-tyrosine-phosphatase n=1 Tax=Flavobacterium sp. TaxID=239 RepID=UPI002974A9E9|nr:low molecular weight protein-tyrosine-phosphatase [Flavobacterium sp.]TAF09108.1 MAG: low molecular weight phosphotyrosine protein phosphatase [Flavobacteriia bacterium]WRH74215.1 MAG: low molecular weight protein-tyrosine-phosphatase [Flavobacterium sp.]
MSSKILMVCLGNICRSPLAEGIMRAKLSKDFIVDSAGTGGWHAGELPDKRSISTAKNRGLDITSQRARQFKISDFNTFDYIYVMDNSNYKDVMALAPNEEVKSKVKLILNELFPNENVDVPDPYYGGQDGFENVFNMLNEACDVIAGKLKR